MGIGTRGTDCRVTVRSGRTGDPIWRRTTGVRLDPEWHAVALVPDADGDGRPDVAVGLPYHDPRPVEPWEARGCVDVLSGTDGRDLLRVDGKEAGGAFGHAIASHLGLGKGSDDAVLVAAPSYGGFPATVQVIRPGRLRGPVVHEE